MVSLDKAQLNRKLAKFAELNTEHRFEASGIKGIRVCAHCSTVFPPVSQDCCVPGYTDDLDLCFRKLVPAFRKLCCSRPDYEPKFSDNDTHVFLRYCEGKGWTTKGWLCSIQGFRELTMVEGAKSPALAFCLAVEKLIDSR